MQSIGMKKLKSKKVSGRLWFLLLTFSILLGMGLMNLYSAGTPFVFRNQLQHTGIGLLIFFILGWFLSPRFFNTYSYILYGGVILGLLLVFVFGASGGGAKRWVVLGPLRFQPSEFAKIGIIFFVAKFFYNNKVRNAYKLWELWPVYAAGGFCFLLIFIQPDFGTAGMCLLIVFAQLCFIRVDLRWTTLLSLSVGGILSFIVTWKFFLRPYQKLRIINLFNPEQDPTGSGYNSLQSLIAIGSGGTWGKGFLQGTQTQLQFLPARQTDFIFSVFAEERGFWGGVFCFSLFCLLSYCALEIAKESKNTFNALVAIGISAFFFIEFAINIAMVLGMFPVVGMPLPFFSYGGTALITCCAAVGLLVGIERETLKA